LTPCSGALKSSKTLDFIGLLPACPGRAGQGRARRENEHAFRVIFCLIKGIKSKNFMRERVGRIRGLQKVPAFRVVVLIGLT
jgi:hypothetical protein